MSRKKSGLPARAGTTSMNDDIATLRGKLKQLKAQHDAGKLDRQAYETGKARLERELVDHVLTDAAATPPAVAPARPAKGLIFAALAVVLVVAGAGYWWTGSPGQASAVLPSTEAPGEAGGANPHAAGEAQFAAAIEKLAERLKGEPENAEGWAMLARSYARLGRLDESVPAFAKAVALRGDDAALLADYADVLAVQSNRSLEGEPLKLVERALKADPNNVKALSLSGTAAFDRKDYAGAVRAWEKVARLAPPDGDFLQQVQAGIAEARQLGGLPPSTAAPNRPAAADAAPVSPPVAAGGGVIRGTVKLAPALAKLADPTDTVFILARPAEGSRMPLAIVRLQVKDLPAEFTLDDSLAMSPDARLSRFPKVVVAARVTKTGQAVASAGDLTGQTPTMANDARGVVIEIKDVVKN